MVTSPTQGEHAQPDALHTIARYKIGYATDDWGMRSSTPSGIPDHAGAWVRYKDHIAALVEAQQPAAHVQNPAKIEHVAGDVSKNGPESNMAQQLAPSAAAAGEVPLPLLVRDIAADLGTTPIQVCTALAQLGFGGHSVNMAVTPRMAKSLRAHFASTTPQADSQLAKFTEILQSWCGARCLPMPSSDDCQSLMLSLEAARAPADSQPAPIDMVLHCPACGLQHIDASEPPVEFEPGAAQWNNPPHRSHLCHGCGHIWRPADVPTNGVKEVKTKGKADSPIQQRDVAGSVALGQPVGNRTDQAASHLGTQGNKLLTVAERNIRSFLRSAVFKSESDREAALNCVDVLWEAARAPADSVTAPAGGVVAELADTINLPDGATLKKEQYTFASPDKLWALYRGKSLIRWLNPFERRFVDAALLAAATTQPAQAADSVTAPVVGTIAHIGTGKTTLTGAITSALRAASAEADSVTAPAGGLVAGPDDREELESVIACLGDDAATLREQNPECEIAANMDRAAELLAAAPTQAADSVLEDAARWRETLMHVGAANHLGGQRFTLNTLRIRDQMFLLRGSVAQHFTACIDDSRAARKQGANHD